MKKQYMVPGVELVRLEQEETISTVSDSYNDGEFSEW